MNAMRQIADGMRKQTQGGVTISREHVAVAGHASVEYFATEQIYSDGRSRFFEWFGIKEHVA